LPDALPICVVAQLSLVGGECLLVRATGLGEGPSQEVGADDRQGGAATYRGSRGISGVAHQRYPPPRPRVQPDLADRVEVEVVCAIHLVEQPGDLPALAPVLRTQQPALGIDIAVVVDRRDGAAEQEYGAGLP